MPGDALHRFMNGPEPHTMHHAKGWTRRHCTAALLGWVGAGTSVRATPSAEPRTVLVLGDSLSAEYGLPRGSGWVTLLGQRLQQERPGWQVVNASISGETTSGGRTRLPSLLSKHHPALPLYTADDAIATLKRLRTVPFGTPTTVVPGIEAKIGRAHV